MKHKIDSEKVTFECGSGNVFADLDLPNPEERQAKAHLLYAINNEIKRRKLTQLAAARIVGLTQPDISRIARGNGSTFSVERLIDVLRKLSIDIEIRLKHSMNGAGKLIVRESSRSLTLHR